MAIDSDDLKTALNLLDRASEMFSDGEKPPDPQWWRDYLTLTRTSSVLTEEGWEGIEVIDEYRKEDPAWEPLEILDFREGDIDA